MLNTKEDIIKYLHIAKWCDILLCINYYIFPDIIKQIIAEISLFGIINVVEVKYLAMILEKILKKNYHVILNINIQYHICKIFICILFLTNKIYSLYIIGIIIDIYQLIIYSFSPFFREIIFNPRMVYYENYVENISGKIYIRPDDPIFFDCNYFNSELTLEGNIIDIGENTLNDLDLIKKLNIINRSKTYLKLGENCIYGMESLVYLTLEGCDLGVLKKDFFKKLKNLKSLKLIRCKIDKLEDDCLRNLRSLSRISIDDLDNEVCMKKCMFKGLYKYLKIFVNSINIYREIMYGEKIITENIDINSKYLEGICVVCLEEKKEDMCIFLSNSVINENNENIFVGCRFMAHKKCFGRGEIKKCLNGCNCKIQKIYDINNYKLLPFSLFKISDELSNHHSSSSERQTSSEDER